MAKSGNYKKIYLNRSLSTVTGGEVKSRLQPDIIGVRSDGTIDLIEVVSPPQTVDQLKLKLDTMLVLLRERAGKNSRVVEIGK